MTTRRPSVFLLSPARCDGRRAAALLRPGALSPVAARLHHGTLTLGEAFSFMSSLYFRGKLAYARVFASATAHAPATLIITPTRGLLDPETPVSVALLEEFASTDLASGDARFRAPLERDAAALAARLGPGVRAVLLGSIATNKYVDVLSPALGGRLHYPSAFIGRGDMSRGGLLLRSAAAGVELEYVPLDASATRRGARPPKLPRSSP